ncbi:cytochrome c oxidase subunit 2 [Pseudoduganella flava]|uniref:Cytochrome C oxidase subunit II n=1 Tax=Pseudoduganella flava TaxID=871742 RepID=A0A562PVC5_9BURK|nr:cytochrome C oxidase subunit II [Pseudoduganella flava]QGZ39483.1 cytochrome C oxidase subunit II [Pseudoduganella flava]TWI48369.1 cytochrome c oxidase subunit 2 [Pseudoduganella flava]
MAAANQGAHDAHATAARAEARWAWIVGAIILFLTGMVAYMSIHWALMPPTRMETIDPATLHLSGEFVESNLGTAREADGSVTVRLLASQYAFTPQCLLVPKDTPVRIRATSSDVVHGFSVAHTNVNMMLAPGYISNFATRFKDSGEFLMPCHEFCGIGHAAMWARVKVVEQNEFARAMAANGRASCVAR